MSIAGHRNNIKTPHRSKFNHKLGHQILTDKKTSNTAPVGFTYLGRKSSRSHFSIHCPLDPILQSNPPNYLMNRRQLVSSCSRTTNGQRVGGMADLLRPPKNNNNTKLTNITLNNISSFRAYRECSIVKPIVFVFLEEIRVSVRVL